MKERLRDCIDILFEDAPETANTFELKEEIYLNLLDKYNDLIEAGRSEEAAYNIAVSSIGDVRELIDSLKNKNITGSAEKIEEEKQKAKTRSALFVAIAVMLYILCLVPLFILQNESGLIFMFVFIASATGLLIFDNMTKSKYIKADDSIVEEFKEWKSKNKGKNNVIKAISAALWSITTAIYLIISVLTMAWHITWIIFLIAGSIEAIIKAIFELKER